MVPTELWKTLGSVAALALSYLAVFWLLILPIHDFSVMSRVGWISAILCAAGASVYFWATIFAPIARKRKWSQRDCQLSALITMLPGAVFIFANHSVVHFANILFYQALFTGFLLTKLVHPDFFKKGPFEKNPPASLFPK